MSKTSPPQRERLRELGVASDRVYLDHGLTGTRRARPGLDQALATVREGDTLVVTKLDRLARSVPDARAIGDERAVRGITLSPAGQVYDPAGPIGKMFFSILSVFAEFEVVLLRLRTKEGMAVARAKGKLRGRQPKLPAKQQHELRKMYGTGEYTVADLAEVYCRPRHGVSHPAPRPRMFAGNASGQLTNRSRRRLTAQFRQSLVFAGSCRWAISAAQGYPTEVSPRLPGPQVKPLTVRICLSRARSW
jgi:DNA invertase Pin-like site-specific DNA recombinase